MFLLDYISDVDMREEITAQTNKVESYNGFTEWLSFGNPYTIVASNDPDEHEKAVKYNDIIANAVMFHNAGYVECVVGTTRGRVSCSEERLDQSKSITY